MKCIRGLRPDGGATSRVDTARWRYVAGGCICQYFGLDSSCSSFIENVHYYMFSVAGVAWCSGSEWMVLCAGVFAIF